MYDVIIIGAGPAGISASLYTKRANLNTLVIYAGESSLEKADSIENYYGFENGIDAKKLYSSGILQAKNLGVEIQNEEVTKIQYQENIFNITTASGQKYISKSVILATGNKKNKPNIKGIDELEGKGISYCAVCDGYFYRNKNIVVIGSGNYAIAETNELINIVNNITILTNGEKAPEIRAENLDIKTQEIKEIHGENRVEEIEFKDNTKIKTDGIFIAQGVAGSTEFAKKLGAIIKNDRIVVNENMNTNIKGLYACGDCTGGLLQISKAVYEGTKAGLEAIKYIRSQKQNQE